MIQRESSRERRIESIKEEETEKKKREKGGRKSEEKRGSHTCRHLVFENGTKMTLYQTTVRSKSAIFV